MNAIEKALRLASLKVDRNPSDARKESGNYSKGHLSYKGLNITIENPKGSERSGVGRNGKRWAVKMPSSYGYIKGTEGHDGDHVDCYIGPDHESDKVWVVDQIDAETGKFDEHKTFLSYSSKDAVLKDYHKAFSDGRAKDRIGGITEFTIDSFKQWLRHSDTTKPLAKNYAAGGVVSGDHSMPLLPGKANVGRNIATERDSGKKLSQAIAIALSVARRGKASGGAVPPPKTANLAPDENAWSRHAVGPVRDGDHGLFRSPSAPGTETLGFDRNTLDPREIANFNLNNALSGMQSRNLPNGFADGGSAVDDTPVIGPLGRNLEIAMHYAPRSTAAALSRLSSANTFPSLVAENPHGWGRLRPDPGSITSDMPPSAVDRALAIGEAPARAYVDQFGRATDAVSQAMGDPSLSNLTNAGVNTGLAIGSPALTLGSGALGFGAAAAQDLAPYVMPGAEARSRKNASDLRPSIMEPAVESANTHDPLADKVAGDPQLEVLYQAYKQAQAKATAPVSGVDKASSDAIRQRASDQATAIMGQIGDALATREKGKSDLANQNYNQQVQEAIAARDLARSRDRRFSDTAVGQLYDKIGVAPVLAGMIPGGVLGLAKGPAKTWGETGLRALEGAGFGAGAAMAPDIYNMSQAPASNPEKEAMDAYSFNLPDSHPDKAKARDYANSLPPMNPIQAAAKENLSDPKLLAERLLLGGLEGTAGASVSQYAPRAIGGMFRPSSYGFGRSGLPPSMTGVGSELEPMLPSGPSGTRSLSQSEIPPTGNLQSTPPFQGQNALAIEPPSRTPEIQRALNVVKSSTPTQTISPELSPEDIASDQGSKLLKEFRKHGIRQFDENGRIVHRVAPGRPDAGQYASPPPKPSRAKGSAKSSTKAEDSAPQNDPNADVPIDQLVKPPKDFDPDDPINRGLARGGVASGLMALAKRYATGGKVAIGPIIGTTGGRADAKDVEVPAGSWVWPADVVAGRGEGNTNSGQEFLANLEKHAVVKLGGRIMPAATRAAGGAIGSVPIKIADGERVSPPEVVWAFGGGDLEHGHRVLDYLTKQFRNEDIQNLQNLPGPSK